MYLIDQAPLTETVRPEVAIDPNVYLSPGEPQSERLQQIVASGNMGPVFGVTVRQAIASINAAELRPEQFETVNDFLGNGLRELVAADSELATGRQFFGFLAIHNTPDEPVKQREIFINRIIRDDLAGQAEAIEEQLDSAKIHNLEVMNDFNHYRTQRLARARIIAPRGFIIQPGIDRVSEQLGTRNGGLLSNIDRLMTSQVEAVLLPPTDTRQT